MYTWQNISGQSSFSWQSGYTAFTVDYRGQSELIDYSLNQERHHRENSRVGGWLLPRKQNGATRRWQIPRLSCGRSIAADASILIM